MRLPTLPVSSWLSISARLWDLLALLLGTITSVSLIIWQQRMSFQVSTELGLLILLHLLITVFGYGSGILFGALLQRIVHARDNDTRSGSHHLRATTVLQIWAWLLLTVLLLHIFWVVLPVAWSGLRCVENNCTSTTALPLHSNKVISYEVREALTLLLWLLVYGLALPLGSSLALRLLLPSRWLGRQTTLYWISCGILLNIALIATFPLADWLGAWYE
jgi:hypothetical protein